MKDLKKYLVEAKNNRKNRESNDMFQLIQINKVYPALIIDAWFDKKISEIGIELVVFNSPSGTRRKAKFRTDSAAIYHYQDICDTIGTDGNPRELIGKSVFLHYEKNGDFQNLKIDERVSKEELQEALEEQEEETDSDDLEVVDELEDFN